MRVVIAQPCPPCVHTIDPNGTAVAKSASSRMTLADFPPSSRNTFFSVSAPFAMIRRPVAVEPVKLIMSTRGSVVSTSPTVAGSPDVTTLSTPGGMSVCSVASLPMNVALQGVSGAGFSTMVLPAASAGVSFDRLSMNGKFQGVMAPMTPTGSCTTLRELCMPMNSCGGSSPSPANVSVRSISHCISSIHQARLAPELKLVGGPPPVTNPAPQHLLLLVEGVLELLETPLAERDVGRPVGVVERAAGGLDRPVHLLGAAVGDIARDLLRGRVDVLVRRPRRRVDELAVDQHPRLGCQLAHAPLLPVCGPGLLVQTSNRSHLTRRQTDASR